MKSTKQSAFIMLLMMVSLTTSRAEDTLWKKDVINSIPDTTENPEKNFLNVPFNSFMDNDKDVHTTENASDKIPVPSDPAVVPFSEPRDEKDVHSTEDASGMIPVPSDRAVVPSTDSKDEKDVHSIEDASDKIQITTYQTINPFTVPRDEITPPVDKSFVDPKNNTTNLPRLNFESVMGRYDSMYDSMEGSTDEPTIIFIRPRPKLFIVQVREFHECVSCHIDDGPRKDFDQCLQKLSLKNQEIVKSCCNTSFENDFCSKASTGNIDYATICKHPEKALNVGDCFWKKIENKDTEDIKEYRECKKQILDRYCVVKSFKEIDPDMEDQL